jgi:hypothetical protein
MATLEVHAPSSAAPWRVRSSSLGFVVAGRMSLIAGEHAASNLARREADAD